MNKEQKYKVCVVTGTRAEYGLLRPLLFRLRECDRTDLQLVVTGSHLSQQYGNSEDEIKQDGFEQYYRVRIPLEDDSKKGMAVATGIALEKFAKLFEEIAPDIIVILGDRFEILAVATAAHLMSIPLAHISGGDLTEGLIDDAIRHSITKMSYLHFPGCAQSADRVIQMGEQPDKVFNVGELGVENCLKVEAMGREELRKSLDFDGVLGDFAIVTFHPVTLENGTELIQTKELANAMNAFEELSYIVTLANSDAGGRAINDFWIEEGKKHPNWLVVNSLGVVRYLSAMKIAKMVIGNSSSGIVETPSMRIPTINIGNRQKGRMCASSVINCEPETKEILEAMSLAMSEEFREIAAKTESPFGDGRTSEKIFEVLLRFLDEGIENTEKTFYDIDYKKR